MNTVSTGPDNLADLPAVTELTSFGEKPKQSWSMSRRAWLAGAISIVVVGSVLRLHHLELVPLHHDEGVNGFFLTGLFRTLSYRYNPENYHGPSLYYFGFISAYLLGLNTLAIRFTTAVFGIATIWMILACRRQMGEIGSLAGAALVAVSPGAVYLSRYFIHETLFVFFTLGIVLGMLRYKEKRELGALVVAWSSAALLFATKETSIITAAVLLVAGTVATTYAGRRRKTPNGSDRMTEENGTFHLRCVPETERLASEGGLRSSIGSSRHISALDWGSAAAIAVLLFLLLYSSFLTNPTGIADAVKAFRLWAQTGEHQHTHPWNAYLSWMWQEESPLLLLSALGGLITIWAAKSKLGVFASLWALGMLAVYSLIPYKTPWLTLNFIIPMAVVVSCAAEAVFRGMNLLYRITAAVLLVGGLSLSAVQCIRLNFYHYDDDSYAYVYAHTQRDFLRLVNDIEEAADRAGTGKATAIAIASPDYWPLPWYLRDYTGVGYFGKVTDSGAPVVVGSETQEQQLEEVLGEQYVRVGSYGLRPGVVLTLYERRDPTARR